MADTVGPSAYFRDAKRAALSPEQKDFVDLMRAALARIAPEQVDVPRTCVIFEDQSNLFALVPHRHFRRVSVAAALRNSRVDLLWTDYEVDDGDHDALDLAVRVFSARALMESRGEVVAAVRAEMDRPFEVHRIIDTATKRLLQTDYFLSFAGSTRRIGTVTESRSSQNLISGKQTEKIEVHCFADRDSDPIAP